MIVWKTKMIQNKAPIMKDRPSESWQIFSIMLSSFSIGGISTFPSWSLLDSGRSLELTVLLDVETDIQRAFWLCPRDDNWQSELGPWPPTLTVQGLVEILFFFFLEVIKHLTVLFSYKMGLKVNNNEFMLTVPTVTALLDRFSTSITSHMLRILLR